MFNIFSKKITPDILIFCGAGISQESGLNTFRDAGGLWNNYDINEVCNMKTFSKNRDIVFSFYNDRKHEVLKSHPNKAHELIAQIQQQYSYQKVKIFTSNIDNLLEKAGCTHVEHIHGDIYSMLCLECSHVWNIGTNDYDINEHCPSCSSEYTKPNIVFFNEIAPKYKEFNIAFEDSGIIHKSLTKKQLIPNIKLIIGTSFNVISLDKFYPQRSKTILVDKNIPNHKDSFTETIQESATTGVEKAFTTIQKWIK